MIRVDRASVPVPAAANGPGSRAHAELAAAVAFYGNVANAGKDFAFKVYKDAGIAAALEALFHKKCAYCEGKYKGAAPVDIEHFRPKGAIAYDDAGAVKLRKPGYYWLAADWTNLLPSCIDCNRPRYQELADPGQGAGRRLSGKANWFPIEDEAHRAQAPGEEANEVPLLLDPCQDDPEQHLEFIEEGVLRPKLLAGGESRKAAASIRYYGLNRRDLVEERAEDQITVRYVLSNVKKAIAAGRAPDQEDLDQIKRFLRPHMRFVAQTRQIVRNELADLAGLL